MRESHNSILSHTIIEDQVDILRNNGHFELFLNAFGFIPTLSLLNMRLSWCRCSIFWVLLAMNWLKWTFPSKIELPFDREVNNPFVRDSRHHKLWNWQGYRLQAHVCSLRKLGLSISSQAAWIADLLILLLTLAPQYWLSHLLSLFLFNVRG